MRSSSLLLAGVSLLLALAAVAGADSPTAAAVSGDSSAHSALLTRLSSTLRSSSSDDGSFPAAGSAAIALLVSFCVVACIAAMLYAGVFCARLAPTPGAGLLLAHLPDPTSARRTRLIALGLVVVGLALHLAALGYDVWSQEDLGDDHTLYFGLVQYRIDSSSSMTYAKVCDMFPADSNNAALCHTVRAAGGVSLAAGILASLGCVLMLFRLLRDHLKSGFTPSSAQLIRTWRLTGLTWVFGELSALAWVSGYIALVEFLSGDSSSSRLTLLGPSCYIALATPMFAALAMYCARQAVLRCPVDPAAMGAHIMQQPAAHYAVVAPGQPLAYQSLVAGQPAMPAGAVVYQQPQGIYMQPQGAYMQPQQQQPAYPVMQPQQQPQQPAYAPPQPRY